LIWVDAHQQIIMRKSEIRVPLPDKGEHVGRRGRKAMGQSWALIAGLPKEESLKGQRTCQGFWAP